MLKNHNRGVGMKKKPVFFKIRIPDWNRTLGLKIQIFLDLVIRNFHKLSVEKRILKIGHNLAELEVYKCFVFFVNPWSINSSLFQGSHNSICNLFIIHLQSTSIISVLAVRRSSNTSISKGFAHSFEFPLLWNKSFFAILIGQSLEMLLKLWRKKMPKDYG